MREREREREKKSNLALLLFFFYLNIFETNKREKKNYTRVQNKHIHIVVNLGHFFFFLI